MNKLKRNDANFEGKQLNYTSLKIMLLVFISFFAGFAVHAMLESSSQILDPFDQYADVLSDQSASNLEAQGFSCHSIYNYDPLVSRCVLDIPAQPFSEVYLLTSGQSIQYLSFVPDSNSITVADLIALWGEPEIQEYTRSAYLFWRDQDIVAIAPLGDEGFTTSLNLWRVYFFADSSS